MAEIPVELTTYASIRVNDSAVLDLTRGEPWAGHPFENEDELLEHLAVNLIARDLRLSQLDGWADLPDDAVEVRIDEIEADIQRELARE